MGKVWTTVAIGLLAAWGADAFEIIESPAHTDIVSDGKIWLRTEHAPFDKTKREETYKVYTQVYDFAGKAPITKGPGGQYPHHRGLFIGWRDTRYKGDTYDTWHMKNCTQEFGAVSSKSGTDAYGEASLRIDWKDDGGKTFIEEVRTLKASEANGVRLIDFTSTLTPLGADVQLRGDLQHAGMQIRMANEVSEHEETTSYILPEGCTELDDNEVKNCWWACASVEVGGKRYSVMHMTPPNHPGGAPVYSIRRYARFGAFWEPDLTANTPSTWTFRVAVTEKELTPADCKALYDAYAATVR